VGARNHGSNEVMLATSLEGRGTTQHVPSTGCDTRLREGTKRKASCLTGRVKVGRRRGPTSREIRKAPPSRPWEGQAAPPQPCDPSRWPTSEICPAKASARHRVSPQSPGLSGQPNTPGVGVYKSTRLSHKPRLYTYNPCRCIVQKWLTLTQKIIHLLKSHRALLPGAGQTASLCSAASPQ
jgi:hypothetical protein